jgi:hypothetical protein
MYGLLLLGALGAGAYLVTREKTPGVARAGASNAVAAAADCEALFDAYVAAMMQAMQAGGPPGGDGGPYEPDPEALGMDFDATGMPAGMLEGMRAIFVRHCAGFSAGTRGYLRSLTASGQPIPEILPPPVERELQPLMQEMDEFVQSAMMQAMQAMHEAMLMQKSERDTADSDGWVPSRPRPAGYPEEWPWPPQPTPFPDEGVEIQGDGTTSQLSMSHGHSHPVNAPLQLSTAVQSYHPVALQPTLSVAPTVQLAPLTTSPMVLGNYVRSR